MRRGGPAQGGGFRTGTATGRKPLIERLLDENSALEEKIEQLKPLCDDYEAEAEGLGKSQEQREKEAGAAETDAEKAQQAFMAYVKASCDEYNQLCEEMNGMFDEVKESGPKVFRLVSSRPSSVCLSLENGSNDLRDCSGEAFLTLCQVLLVQRCWSFRD